MDVAESPESWTLRGTNGWAELQVSVASESRSSIELMYDQRLWDAPCWRMSVQDVAVDVSVVQRMRTWAISESDELMDPVRGRRSATFDLLDGIDAKLEIAFDDRPDLILGAGQTGCSVHVAAFGAAATVLFVTDVTCLDLLAQEIWISMRP